MAKVKKTRMDEPIETMSDEVAFAIAANEERAEYERKRELELKQETARLEKEAAARETIEEKQRQATAELREQLLAKV